MKLYLQFIEVCDDFGQWSEAGLHYWDENEKKWVYVETARIKESYYDEFIKQPPTT